LLGSPVVWAQSAIFSAKPGSKNAIIDYRAALWQIFSTNKSAPANRKKGFFKSFLLKNDKIGGIFVFSGKELQTLFKNSKGKFLNYNHIPVNVLS